MSTTSDERPTITMTAEQIETLVSAGHPLPRAAIVLIDRPVQLKADDVVRVAA